MAKITIENVTINVYHGDEIARETDDRAAAAARLVQSLQGGLEQAIAEMEARMEDTESDTPAAEAPLGERIIAFLKSDERYTCRTADAIHNHFIGLGSAGFFAVRKALEDGLNCGALKSLRRRRDGAVLYQAA